MINCKQVDTPVEKGVNLSINMSHLNPFEKEMMFRIPTQVQ